MPKQSAPKCKLEEPGDISLTLAPAALKKPKAVSVGARKNTCTATKQANSNSNNNSLPRVQTISKPDEDPVHSQPTTTTTKTTQPKKAATSTEKAPQTPDNLTPTKPPLSATGAEKLGQARQPSAIAGKANKQVIAKQSAKKSKAAKKAKKAEMVVIEETPKETAAFLAKVKGQSQPSKTSPNLTSPKHPRPLVNHEDALEQLLNACALSPSPGAALPTTTKAKNTTWIVIAAPDNSIPDAGKPKPKPGPRPTIVTQLSLKVPCSTPPSCNVSPVALSHLQIPLSIPASHKVSLSAESMATVDDNYNKDVDMGIDYKALLDGIPKPWNLGPVSMPPLLPKPLHAIKLKPKVLEKVTRGGMEKQKAAQPLISSFCIEDQVHLKLALEYMD